MKPSPSFPWRRALVAALMLALFIGAVEWLAGWAGVLAALRRLPATAILSLLAGLIASYLLRGARLYFYFHAELAGRFLPALRLTLIHNATANLLPMRTGELSFPLLAKRQFGLAATRTVAALLWFRLLDLLLLGCIALGVLASGFSDSPQIPLLAWLPALALPVVILLVSPSNLRQLARHMPKKLAGMLDQAAEGLPPHHAAALRDLAITAANWGTKLLALGVVFVLLVDAAAWQAGIAAVAGEVSGILPVATPAGLGAYEAVVVAAALPFGIGAALALQAAVTLHLLILTSSLAGFAIATWLPEGIVENETLN